MHFIAYLTEGAVLVVVNIIRLFIYGFVPLRFA
jgi:hypothetical protein